MCLRPSISGLVLLLMCESCGNVEVTVGAVSSDRYQSDLIQIAKERPSGSTHWKTVQDLCAQRLRELGYTVEINGYGTGSNVIGRLAGEQSPEQQVLLSAHYDSIEHCPGADDNASGVAGLLEAARVLGSRRYRRTLVIAFWDEEEHYLVGSEKYATSAEQRGDKIEVVYVFEMIGFKSGEPNSQQIPAGLDLLYPAEVAQVKANQSRGDFITVIYDEHSSNKSEIAATAMQKTSETVSLPFLLLKLPLSLKGAMEVFDLYRSDHTSFWRTNVPALMITDTSEYRNPYSHCSAGPDSVEHLDSAFAARVVQATVGSATQLLQAD